MKLDLLHPHINFFYFSFLRNITMPRCLFTLASCLARQDTEGEA